jgi:hypothetical protein
MRHRLTKFGKAALIVGAISLLLLFIMNTEVQMHPFSIHIHKAEKLMEVFIQVCAFLFFDFHGRWEGFKEGSMFTLDLIKRESEKRENEEVDKTEP